MANSGFQACNSVRETIVFSYSSCIVKNKIVCDKRNVPKRGRCQDATRLGTDENHGDGVVWTHLATQNNIVM